MQILTQCVLSGQFGEGEAAWRLVPQLPFEIAALPQRAFRWLRLPVVSYALPALIAIGQVRHARRPTWNPLARLARRLASSRTLRVLQRIQPAGGGFLEATPLTSFVAMSLIGAGHAEHLVVVRCLDFLLRSADADGAWPIDTNLATWVTTLSVNALSPSGDRDGLPADEAARIADWLLAQQYRERHPYTDAAPGGWAWTDLAGGVPDADDTAGALLALRQLCDPSKPRVLDAVGEGVRWLLDLQNRDGGMPTFCRGWGTLPFDPERRPISRPTPCKPGPLGAPNCPALCNDASHGPLRAGSSIWPACSGANGAGRRSGLAINTRPTMKIWYSTPVACSGPWLRLDFVGDRAGCQQCARRGGAGCSPRSLAQQQLGEAGADDCSIEETALATAALAADLRSLRGRNASASTADSQLQRLAGLAVEAMAGRQLLAPLTDAGQRFPPAPIGLYFAKLWYYETLYPLIWTVAATGEPPPR